MLVLSMPYLIGQRVKVHELLAEEQVPDDLTGVAVALVLTCARASSEVADELVHQLLERRGAAELAVIGDADEFLGFVAEAATRRRVADRISVHRAPLTEFYPGRRLSLIKEATSAL